MTSLLVLTPDIKVSDDLHNFCASNEIRVRCVSEYDQAKEWLSMQSFDILLVDIGAEPIRGFELLELGWKYSPLLVAGIFNLGNPGADSWSATLIGAKVFFGEHAVSKIHEFLLAFPRSASIAEEKFTSVLLVEDLDSPRDIVTTYVQSLGYEHVSAVASAADALALLRSKPEEFFCLIADIHMPKMSGIELVREIRKDTKLRYLPIVILTADPSSENLIECVKSGASGFLAKPPKKKTLLKELERAKRCVIFKQSPRLCDPKDAHLLEDALNKNRF